MSDAKITTTVTIEPALRERLDTLATAVDRSRSWLVSRAVANFLDSVEGLPMTTPQLPAPQPVAQAATQAHLAAVQNLSRDYFNDVAKRITNNAHQPGS